MEKRSVEASRFVGRGSMLILPIRKNIPPTGWLEIGSGNLFRRLNVMAKNLSPQPIPVGGALHTYLAISNTANVYLHGLQNTPYIDTTTDPDTTATDQGEKLSIDAEVDRTYYGTSNPVTVHDAGWNRKITISKRNSLTTVVWNPWIEKAAALGDLPDAAYWDFLCVEAANARHDTRIVAPGETHCLATTLSVDPETA